VRSNVALKTDAPRRQKTLSRAWTIGNSNRSGKPFSPLGARTWNSTCSSCGSISKPRQTSGALTLVLDALDWTGQTARLTEKGGTVNNQPVSRGLIGALIAHASSAAMWSPRRSAAFGRGRDGRRRPRAAGHAAGDQPVFYYKNRWMPKARSNANPPAHAAALQQPLRPPPTRPALGRPDWGPDHDMRKTGAVFVERACGYAVARNWLRHSGATN